MSLRLRVNLLFTLIILLFAAAFGAALFDATKRSIREEIETSTKIGLQLLGRLTWNADSTNTVATRLTEIGRVRALDIRFYDRAGVLVYQSPPSPYRAGDVAPAWFARLVAPVVATERLALTSGVLVATPDVSRSTLEAWEDFTQLLALGLGFFVLVNALVFWRVDAWVKRDIAEHERARRTEVELEQSRRLARAVQEHVEAERKEIARELHDELGQSITAIKTIAVSIARRAEGSSRDIHDHATKIAAVAGDLYDVVRDIVHKLRPSALDHIGLGATLHDVVGGFRRHHPEIEFKLDIDESLDDLAETTGVTIYRVVQEALTNVVRHARAHRVAITVGRIAAADGSPHLRVTIADDGCGMPPEPAPPGHFGLIGIRERVQALGGRLEVATAPGGGARLDVGLPYICRDTAVA